VSLLLTVAVMYGITFGIKDAKLFSRPRQWLADRSLFLHELLSCAYCVGFHSGWLTYLLLVPVPDDWATFIRSIVAYAFAGVTISGALDAILQRIENSA
jgi:uncharacterized membrane protein